MAEGPIQETCPRCGSSRQSLIVYGLVLLTDEVRAQLHDGSLALGGCAITANDPEWACRDCGHRWGSSRQSRSLLEFAIAQEKARKERRRAGWGWLGRLLFGRGTTQNAAPDDQLWDPELDA